MAMVGESEGVATASRRMSKVELDRVELERDLGKPVVPMSLPTNLSSKESSNHLQRFSALGGTDHHFEASLTRARGRSSSQLTDLTNVGFKRRSTANNIRASIVQHAMTDTVRRLRSHIQSINQK